MRRGAEAAQQAHHVVVMFRRRRTNAEDPVEEIRVVAIQQRVEPVELGTVQALKKLVGEHAENEVAFLRSAMPASERQPPETGVQMLALKPIAKEIAHSDLALAINPAPLITFGRIAEDAARQCLPSSVATVQI